LNTAEDQIEQRAHQTRDILHDLDRAVVRLCSAHRTRERDLRALRAAAIELLRSGSRARPAPNDLWLLSQVLHRVEQRLDPLDRALQRQAEELRATIAVERDLIMRSCSAVDRLLRRPRPGRWSELLDLLGYLDRALESLDLAPPSGPDV